MLELIKLFLQKVDFVAISELVRKRTNRTIAAQLYLILAQSYEIIEIYHILLDELQAALDTHYHVDDNIKFSLNQSRIIHLLNRQSSNLEVMECLTGNLIAELRIIDNEFLKAFNELIPGKTGVLFEAQNLLNKGRLPLAETSPKYFPASTNGEYRSLSFVAESITSQQDRKKNSDYLYGYSGREKIVIDVNVNDVEAFFKELSRYFEQENPKKKLHEIEELTDGYKDALIKNFSLEDCLSEIGKLRKHHHWIK